MFAFTVNKDYKFVIDKHEAKKAGLHYDLRILNNDKEVYSFATKHELIFNSENTKRSNKRLLLLQPIHSYDWIKVKDLYIGDGYGHGHIKTWDSGTITIKSLNKKNTVNFIANGEHFKGNFLLIKYSDDESKYLLIKRKDDTTK